MGRMKHRLLLGVTALIMGSGAPSLATTISVAPNPAQVSQTVTVTVTSTYLTVPSCTVEVDFGDGAPGTWNTIGQCTVSPCTLVTSHTYTSPGSYTVSARNDPPCVVVSVPTAPDPVSTGLLVNSLIPPPTGAQVEVTPRSFRVPRTTASIQNLTYDFAISPPQTVDLTSSGGTFEAGGTVVGQTSFPLTSRVRNGAATVSEALAVPVGVIKRAERLGQSRIAYRRTFTDSTGTTPTISLTAQTEIVLTTEAGAEFRVTRIHLYFENGRSETTVQRNQPPPGLFADVRYTGSGLLQGHWEVDGRVLSRFFQHLVYGREVTLSAPELPPLPTFDPGTHRASLVITAPSGVDPLTVLYFVTAEEARRAAPLRLTSPAAEAQLEYGPPSFQWEPRDGVTAYLLEILEDGAQESHFSAYTRRPSYALPSRALERILSAGGGYRWRVKAIDAEEKVVAASDPRRFTLAAPPTHKQEEVVAVFEPRAAAQGAVEIVRARHGFTLIETFDLSTLGVTVAVYGTHRPLPELIQTLGGEPGIVSAQFNWIFRTLGEPLSGNQNLVRVLNLEAAHTQATGRGVRVGVIDTGVDTSHPDLVGQIALARDFLADGSRWAEIHGTAVAGVIGAGRNGFGIAGVAPDSELLALRACEQVAEGAPEGLCYTSSVAKALDEAVGAGAQVVNMSIGMNQEDGLIARVLDEGAERGVLFVAPAGNHPRQKNLSFPASHPRVTGVAGLDEDGSLFPNAALAEAAAVCAPARNVFTSIPGGRHNFLSGTSISAASVSGILALALEHRGSADRVELPHFDGNLCRWAEQATGLKFCAE